jgi:hypothetical protein
MDYRSREEFADDIKTYTGIEGFIMDKWIQEMNATENKDGCTWFAEDAGCDNSGKVIEGFVGVNHDYEVTCTHCGVTEQWFSVDVKHNYNDATATFKAHNLEAYAKGDIWMLLVIGTGLNGRELRPPAYEDAWKASFGRRQWALVSPKQTQKIIDEVPCTKIRFMGNRPGYMIYARQFDTYFNMHEFEKV